jgi:CHASE2 domain-containing sensor protein
MRWKSSEKLCEVSSWIELLPNIFLARITARVLANCPSRLTLANFLHRLECRADTHERLRNNQVFQMRKTIRNWFCNVSNQRLFRLALIAAAVGILLVSLTPLADLSYDLSFQAMPVTTITNAALVYINEGTLEDLGSDHGSLNRAIHAQLINRLANDGARLVFYDVVFDQTNQSSQSDQSLVLAVRNQRSVILVGGSEDSIEQGAGVVTSLYPPIQSLREVAKGWGHAELFGNVVRQVSGDYEYIHYAVWVAATNLESKELKDANANRIRWLNYYGGTGSGAFPQCSLEDALSNNVPAGFFTGKIVFVGQNFPSAEIGSRKDTFATPFSCFGASPMPGVEIHATALLNLLRNDWLREVPWLWQCLGAVIWAIVGVGALYPLSRKSSSSEPTTKIIHILVLALVAVFAAALLCAFSLYVQWHLHWWWSWVGPVFGQTTTALILVCLFPKPDPYIAFISYRTKGDSETALLIEEKLSGLGHKTFVDVKRLQAGKFDEQLLSKIQDATFFILILSPNSLVRCVNEGDWVLKEIAHALANKKTIIPVLKNGFDFDAKEGVPDLPEIVALKRYQGITYSHNDVEGFITRLTKHLKEP